MGWEGREWAKWSEDERDTYLEGRAPRRATGRELLERIDSPHSTGVSLRAKIWGGLAAVTVAFAAIVVYEIHANPLTTGSPSGAVQTTPPVLYGWQHIPSQGVAYTDPSRIGNTSFHGRPILCTDREHDELGRWVCTTYTIVQPGQRIVVMPADSPLHGVRCNVLPSAPCPDTT
jgi:hypothetical protein